MIRIKIKVICVNCITACINHFNAKDNGTQRRVFCKKKELRSRE